MYATSRERDDMVNTGGRRATIGALSLLAEPFGYGVDIILNDRAFLNSPILVGNRTG